MSDLMPGQEIQRLSAQAVIEAYDKGREHERERIIKLLKADICPDWESQFPYCCDGACGAYNDAINLIQGEQK